MGEVFRPPVFAVHQLHVDRRVLHDGGGVVVPALQRRQIDERLHQRAHRAVRIQRAVKAVVTDIAPADDGDHVAALR